MPNLPLILIPFALAIAHYIGLHRTIKNRKLSQSIRSFSGGFSIAYVFILVIPEMNRLNVLTSADTIAFTVIGFALFHVLLKFIFKQRNSKKRVALLDEVHTATSALYSFLLSFSLVELSKLNISKSLILVILVLLHNTLSELSHKELTHKEKNKWKSPILIGATLCGGLFPLLNLATTTLTASIYAFAAGAIIYITIREEVPDEKEGSPVLFLLGVLLLIVAKVYI